jgi:hypothetical protein
MNGSGSVNLFCALPKIVMPNGGDGSFATGSNQQQVQPGLLCPESGSKIEVSASTAMGPLRVEVPSPENATTKFSFALIRFVAVTDR